VLRKYEGNRKYFLIRSAVSPPRWSEIYKTDNDCFIDAHGFNRRRDYGGSGQWEEGSGDFHFVVNALFAAISRFEMPAS